MSRQPPQCLWPKQHPQLRALGAAARDGVLHRTKLTTSRALAPAASDCPHRGCLQVHSLLVCRRPHLSAYHQEYSRLLHRMSTARSLGFVRLTVHFDSVLMMELLAFAKTTRIGLTAGVLSCLARQADTLLSLLTSILIRNQLLSSCSSLLVALLVLPLALVSAVGDRLSSFRSFPATLVLHVAQINAPWRTTSTDLGTISVFKMEAGIVTDRSLAENFYVITQHHCAVLLNKDTFARDFTCTPIQDPRSLTYSSWAVEGMVVTGKEEVCETIADRGKVHGHLVETGTPATWTSARRETMG